MTSANMNIQKRQFNPVSQLIEIEKQNTANDEVSQQHMLTAVTQRGAETTLDGSHSLSPHRSRIPI